MVFTGVPEGREHAERRCFGADTVMTKFILLPAFLLFFVYHVNGFNVPESFIHKTDSLFNCSDEEPKTYVDVFRNDTDNRVYYASTTEILEYNIDTLRNHLTDVSRYNQYFKFIAKSELIENYKSDLKRDVYFCVATASFAKALFIGSIDSVTTQENGDVTIFFNKYHDEALNREFYENERGILKVQFHEFNMFFTLRKIEENKTKVLLTSVVSPKIWIPNWLFRMVANFLFPGILSNLDDWLKDNYE
ncbi:hypothetical protein CHISP_0298 [Chitinispirillum alkaliphilum]|nr:hypothetical protein CHISP_0298 [Chitinispirillum alkaliphilum]